MLYNIHTHASSNDENVIELVNFFPHEINLSLPNFTIGIHPYHIDESKLYDELDIIEKHIQHPHFFAVGECGFDKRIQTPIAIQKKILIPQLLLAEKYKKPVVLHCVSAYQEIIEIKKELNLTIPMIIHGFAKNAQVAKSLYTKGFYLSFGKYLLLNPKLSDVLKEVPKEQIFLETDTMAQTIYDVYQKASEILDEDVVSLIEKNFERVFNP